MSDGDDWATHRFVTAHQAASFLSVHVRTIYRWAVDGKLRAHHISGSRAVRFRRKDVERLLIARDQED